MSYNKYYLQKKQVSLDNGLTWEDVDPIETRQGAYIGSYSSLTDCNGTVEDKGYLTLDIVSGGTIAIYTTNHTIYTQVSINQDPWVNVLSDGSPINVNAGDKVFLKGEGYPAYEYPRILTLSTASFNVSGNIMSLVSGDSFDNATITERNAFERLFQGTKVIDASELILPYTVYIGSYFDMFSGCTSLTDAPVLPATTLDQACYYGMFEGCTSLTKAPVLPATTLVQTCYMWMFNGCTSLNEITCLATNISASNCTGGWVQNVATNGTFYKASTMSNWTTGINGIPTRWVIKDYGDLPYEQQYFTIESTSNNNNIYLKAVSNTNVTVSASTDNGSTWTAYTSTTGNGTTIATLNTGDKVLIKGTNEAYTNNRFNSSGQFEIYGNIMSLLYGDNFSGQTALTDNYLFSTLFYNSTGLTSAENLIMPATTLTEACYQGMFSNCTSLTTAPELPATTLANSCYSQMFYGCTSLTSAPALPATTLNIYCYDWMFYGCTSLTTAPELPATTLVNSCYRVMFNGCTSLNYIKCLATDISASSCTVNWVNGVAASGTFVKDANTTWATGTSGIPSGWTVQNNS